VENLCKEAKKKSVSRETLFFFLSLASTHTHTSTANAETLPEQCGKLCGKLL
jgi:hypothetical protein